jgi:hypothetical protein
MAMAMFNALAKSTRVVFVSASLLLVSGSALGQTGSSETKAVDALAEAKSHFSNGVELLQASPPNYQDAFRQFQLAYDKSNGSWKVLGNLGLCALKLERDGEALKYYEQYLEKGGAEIDPGERSAIERDLLLVRGNLATVSVRSSKPDTKLLVTRKGSNVPTQTYLLAPGENSLGLRSGELSLTAVNGSAQETWEVILGPSETATHDFLFVVPKPTTPGGPVVQEAPAAGSSEPQRAAGGLTGVQVAGIVTGGVGVLGIVGGVITGVLAKSAESDAEAKCIEGICLESTRKDFQAASDMATLANVLFISGGVLAATGLTLVLVGGKKSEKPTDNAALLEVRPVALGTNFLGLSATGTF